MDPHPTLSPHARYRTQISPVFAGCARLQTRASTGSERQAAKPREFKEEIEEAEEIEAFMVTFGFGAE